MTAREVALVDEMRAQGYSVPIIAREIGRAVSTVYNHAGARPRSEVPLRISVGAVDPVVKAIVSRMKTTGDLYRACRETGTMTKTMRSWAAGNTMPSVNAARAMLNAVGLDLQIVEIEK